MNALRTVLLLCALTPLSGVMAADAPAKAATNAITPRLLAKPERFGSWSERLAFLKHNVPLTLNHLTYQTDTLFLDPGELLSEKQPETKLRLGVYAEFEKDGAFRLRFDPDFEVDVTLPNLEQQWKVFISPSENDELPGTDPTERERGAQVGARKTLKNLNVNVDAGIKMRWLPEAFAKAEWRPDWYVGGWRFSPRQRVYAESDEGFGEVTSLAMLRWFGERMSGVFQSVSAARWTEETEGVEWEQTLKIGRVLALLDESRRGKSSIQRDDATRGVGLRYSVFGHDNASFVVDRHRITVAYRAPAYENWIFYEIAPGVEWEDENDWKTVPSVRVGLDMLFWGEEYL